MQMTHYMELLAVNQPWNLIIFMAIPVILAETIAITELYLLFTRKTNNKIKKINQISGIIAGLYFLGVAFYIMFNAIVPLTINSLWRGPADIIAVWFYFLGIVPLFSLFLIDSGIIMKSKDDSYKMKWHAVWVGVFLIVAHVAMIFGMLNPSVLGYQNFREMKMEIPH